MPRSANKSKSNGTAASTNMAAETEPRSRQKRPRELGAIRRARVAGLGSSNETWLAGAAVCRAGSRLGRRMAKERKKPPHCGASQYCAPETGGLSLFVGAIHSDSIGAFV